MLPLWNDYRLATLPQPTQGKMLIDLTMESELYRIGIGGGAPYPSTSVDNLVLAYKRNEIAFAAIRAKAEAAADPRLLVQRRVGADWSEVEGHPLRRLIMRPNRDMDESAFIKCAVSHREISGWFHAEIIRSSGTKQPLALEPISLCKSVKQNLNDDGQVVSYEVRQDRGRPITIPAKNMLAWKYHDPENRMKGLSPLAVALGSVEADTAQTDYAREFFNNAGVPSGILKILDRTLKPKEGDDIKARWRDRFSRMWGGRQHDIVVLDQNAEYQQLGANLDQLNSEVMREFTETRVAMTFGVPTLIIYAYAGLKRATYSNLKEAMPGFWDTTMSPLLKEWRTFLTWRLLTEFENEDLVFGEQVRLFWDMSTVAALQEDVNAIHTRALQQFQGGGVTLNEYRSIIGQPPDPAGDYYVRPLKSTTVPAGAEVLQLVESEA